jgi:AraC-like DNA-binding protein
VAYPQEDLLTFCSLYRSPLVSVREYTCRAGRGGPAREEYSGIDNIVLMRHGAFCKHLGRQVVTAGVNQAMFFAKGSSYRVSHPADCGDRGTTLDPAPEVLREIMSEFDPAAQDRPDCSFPFFTSPVPKALFWKHHRFLRRLESSPTERLDSLWVETEVLRIVADIVGAAYERRESGRVRTRRSTQADHAERAEAAKVYLASRLGERITLANIARAVHLSPFHLTRVFREQVGMPMHRYLTQLRLRGALEHLAEGQDDLTALALKLGFSSHSHFTDAFRREFGSAPSSIRVARHI